MSYHDSHKAWLGITWNEVHNMLIRLVRFKHNGCNPCSSFIVYKKLKNIMTSKSVCESCVTFEGFSIAQSKYFDIMKYLPYPFRHH